MADKKPGMNLPNKLTVLRILLVPVFLIIMMLPDSVLPSQWSGLVGVAIFIVASLTDMLDGKIARKYDLVTDFGKLMDPLADKFMVIGALCAIVYRNEGLLQTLFIVALLVVVFRELAVTSLRLVASSSGGVVVPANMLGKIKTVTQIVCVCAAFIEPIVYGIPAVAGNLPAFWDFAQFPPLTWLFTALMIVFTIASGINYFTGMWKYLDPQK